MSADTVELFRHAIARTLGLHFDDGKSAFLAQVLERRASASNLAPARYVARLDALARDEARELARELTVGETYFLRHIDQFKAFGEVAVPELMQRASTLPSPLSVLSSGCSSGEEAYSLAIVLKELAVDAAWAVTAIDLNPASLEKAAQGRYSEWSLRDAPPEFRTRWFRTEGRDLVLDAGVRGAVRFEERNLNHEDPDFWSPNRFGVIFCRNVLMYFEPAAAQRIVERYFHALVPGGFLFLGHAETLRGVSNDFQLRHTHQTFYYQRKDGASSRSLLRRSVLTWPTAPAPALDGGPDRNWVDLVQASSERIVALTERDEPAHKHQAAPRFDMSAALSCLKAERFQDALGLLPPTTEDTQDTMLLRAALLTHDGQLDAAADACERLLELDSLNAGAHYLLAMCADGHSDARAATDHDQIAAYLDDSFAMPRLHLGLLARRAGAKEAAVRELGQALMLLQRDDPTRLLLFGGGFSREGLMSLCRAELTRLERRA